MRDISWLSFNERVLQEAADKSVHPYHRLRFLGIFSNNMDEFFRVRVATLQRMVQMKKTVRMYLEKNPEKILDQIQSRVLGLRNEFDVIFDDLLHELKERNIELISEQKLLVAEQEWVRKYFHSSVRTVLMPLMLKSLPKAPALTDGNIYLACILKSRQEQDYALMKVPSDLPRFIRLPEFKEGRQRIILLENVIRFCLPELFSQFGYKSFEAYTIKMTRDAELDLDPELDGGLILALEKGLKKRRKGRALRFVYDKNIPNHLLDYLKDLLGLRKRDHLIAGGRIHNFKDFMNFPSELFPNLGKSKKPFVHPLLEQPIRIMKVLQKRDIMLHLPYHSFDSIIDLLREAAVDPKTKSILISCYRLASNSKIINALIGAARNGKKVTVSLELRARFNEEENLNWTRVLEDEGVNVLHGQQHMKVHSKIGVITRAENNDLAYYSFISTGNLNENTASYYTDHYLLTSNKEIGYDIQKVFQFIANPKNPQPLKQCRHLICSPNNTRETYLRHLQEEIELGTKGHCIIKLNSLSDEQLMRKLREAAEAGVKVELIVRGIFRLKFGTWPSRLFP